MTRAYYFACSPFGVVSGRSNKETWVGCIVSLTTPNRSPRGASRSVSSRSSFDTQRLVVRLDHPVEFVYGSHTGIIPMVARLAFETMPTS